MSQDNSLTAIESGVKAKTNLKRLLYSPDRNPLLECLDIKTKRKHIRTGLQTPLANIETGEIQAASVIHSIQEKDEAEFVKVFSAGIAACFDLNTTAARVFQSILSAYERTPMKAGFAESIYLAWFDGGLCGNDIGMSEKTFQRGLKDLIDKEFLAPKSPNLFWVNPALFFKGDRVLFVKEYRRTRKIESKKVDSNATN